MNEKLHFHCFFWKEKQTSASMYNINVASGTEHLKKTVVEQYKNNTKQLSLLVSSLLSYHEHTDQF